MAEQPNRVSLKDYSDLESLPPVFHMTVEPTYSPIDINLAYLFSIGWRQSVDRFRLHTELAQGLRSSHLVDNLISDVEPHLLIRKLEQDEDRFIVLQIRLSGEIESLSNDEEYSQHFIKKLCLDCPPSFRRENELRISGKWEDDSNLRAKFSGLLAGALGWDPRHGIPDGVADSLEEAKRSLETANYRSCVVMCRRAIEALLEFGMPRLLAREAINRRGQRFTLDSMIQCYRDSEIQPIPFHLLHVADSVRLIGNVPGAHAQEIEDYQFSRSDAEFALQATSHFVTQYFSKVDSEVTEYYSLSIELDDSE